MRIRNFIVFIIRIVGIAIFTVGGMAVILYVTHEILSARLRVIDREEKAELRILFPQLIADGVIPNPPNPIDNFTVTSRHGNDPYIIRYLDSAANRTGYFVSKHFPDKGVWNFKELSAAPHVFTTPRLKAPIDAEQAGAADRATRGR